MSRRKRSADEASPERPPRPGLAPRLLADGAILAATLVVVTALALLLGAANLGVALGIATIVFAVVLMAVMLRA